MIKINNNCYNPIFSFKDNRLFSITVMSEEDNSSALKDGRKIKQESSTSQKES
jgi:hypothetical protein